ncbi:UNKNOWN [Stylonychia lemnae]|uniref:Uncharacterized protein n=1 Tax=Stylonychia lemnae TaxID=5949 RepID=A0A078B9Y4_STYLE|nr:UNKNOWN [Stylonychia lemnae]|eukprot:CDW91026.1 UNKNOWN [Stylonychia lemnae]
MSWPLDLCEIKEIFHSKYGSYQFKVLIAQVQDSTMIKEKEIQQSISVWVSYENERPYHKIQHIYVHHYLLSIIFEESNILYLINMASNEELQYRIPFTFSNPTGLYLSDQYIFLTKENQVLWLYDVIISDDFLFQNELLTFFNQQQDINNYYNNNEPNNAQFQYEDVKEVKFVLDPQNTIKYKIIQMEAKVIKIQADCLHAVIIQQLPSQNDDNNLENESDQTTHNQSALKDTIESHFSNMFRSITRQDSDNKNLQTVNILSVDLKACKKLDEKLISYDQVSIILRYFSLQSIKKFEVIMINDKDFLKRLYVLEKKEPRGFKLVEIERDLINTLIDIDLNLIDWNYDQDQHKLVLLYLNQSGKQCVKVIPFGQIRKTANTQFAGDGIYNKYIEIIQDSSLSYEEEVLSQLDGKVFPIQSYINYDNYVILGHANVISFKNLTDLCSQNQNGWEHMFRDYKQIKSKTEHYTAVENFDQDIYYFFMSGDSLYVRYMDGKKKQFSIRDNKVKIQDVYTWDVEKSVVGKVLKIRELLTIKDKPFIVFDLQNQFTQEITVNVVKSDSTKNIIKNVMKLQLLDQENFNVLINRKDATIAILYQDQITRHKICGGKSQSIQTIQFKGQLSDLDVQQIDSYQVNTMYIFILSKDLLYIINLAEEKLEQIQRLGINMKHFLIFENKYIYWLEKGDNLQKIKFDYIDPKCQIKLLDCEVFSGSNQLNMKQLI